jgi:Tol biopolymer transport system component
LVLLDLETGAVVRTFDIQNEWSYRLIRWTRDGSALTYVDEQSKLWRMPVDGSPSSVLMDFAPDQVFGFDWSPDGTELVVAKGQWNQDVVLIRDTTRR